MKFSISLRNQLKTFIMSTRKFFDSFVVGLCRQILQIWKYSFLQFVIAVKTFTGKFW